jgi:serine/threonine protein kinase
MFRNEEEEYCLESKGTECIQSPEMLTLAIYSKKEGDRYDRRKKVGTTRSSDIWSLGCLFFEILTGEFLYYSSN